MEEPADAMSYRARKIQYMWENDKSGESFFARDYWVGSFDFMSRPLFQRRWILEEIVSAGPPPAPERAGAGRILGEADKGARRRWRDTRPL